MSKKLTVTQRGDQLVAVQGGPKKAAKVDATPIVTLRKKQTADLVVVKADERVAHGVVVTVMDIAKTSGFSKIAIATQ